MTGSTAPVTPMALASWMNVRYTTVVPRLMAMPMAVPWRGLVTASGAPKRAMTRQAAGSAILSARSTSILLVSLPERLSASM